ncbi:MAG: sugar phosphate nucleotidyltransferase [Bdellovibrionales bacterium]|nr:sugar phosphate nucleotidyltransferase [Bdellovibrionales bacterium]
MSLEAALILSAGFGTRMGEIGKVLPKPLWPLYEKNVIDLQIQFCRWKGIKNIYINTHHLHELIKDFIEKNNHKDVHILHEDEILDSGGAIHNFFKNTNHKNVLYLASDQFYFFDDSSWRKGVNELKNSRAVLFTMNALGTDKYREFVIENDRLIDIRDHIDSNNYITFSGLGFINLEDFKYRSGPSNFFDSVANYKNEKVITINPVEQEYWDFGTYDLYFKNCFEVLKSKGRFNRFLLDTNSIRSELYHDKRCSYKSNDPLVLNFTSQINSKPLPGPSIIMRGDDLDPRGCGLYYNDEYQEVRG